MAVAELALGSRRSAWPALGVSAGLQVSPPLQPTQDGHQLMPRLDAGAAAGGTAAPLGAKSRLLCGCEGHLLRSHFLLLCSWAAPCGWKAAAVLPWLTCAEPCPPQALAAWRPRLPRCPPCVAPPPPPVHAVGCPEHSASEPASRFVSPRRIHWEHAGSHGWTLSPGQPSAMPLGTWALSPSLSRVPNDPSAQGWVTVDPSGSPWRRGWGC